MKIIKNNNSGYSIIISIVLVGFLVVLTSGVLNLVLGELNDGRGRSDYMKAFAAAEGSMELSLLNIKNKGYGYYDKIDNDVNNRSIILGENPLDLSKFKKSKDVLISYDNDSKINSYSGTIKPLGYDIIPLFYLDDSGEHKVNKIELMASTFTENLAWNILSNSNGISGTGNINGLGKGNLKTALSGKLRFSKVTTKDFLSDSSNKNNYLILFNSNSSESINYNLKTGNKDEFFTKPRLNIVSSAKIGNYKQNIVTELDNTSYLNILKYSIYSN